MDGGLLIDVPGPALSPASGRVAAWSQTTLIVSPNRRWMPRLLMRELVFARRGCNESD